MWGSGCYCVCRKCHSQQNTALIFGLSFYTKDLYLVITQKLIVKTTAFHENWHGFHEKHCGFVKSGSFHEKHCSFHEKYMKNS